MVCEYGSESSSYLGTSWVKKAIPVGEDEGFLEKTHFNKCLQSSQNILEDQKGVQAF